MMLIREAFGSNLDRMAGIFLLKRRGFWLFKESDFSLQVRVARAYLYGPINPWLKEQI